MGEARGAGQVLRSELHVEKGAPRYQKDFGIYSEDLSSDVTSPNLPVREVSPYKDRHKWTRMATRIPVGR